jgi:hypothetical protein
MSWRSVGSGRYYQRSYRDADGRVRSEYLGRGPAAEAVAARVALARERRAERAERVRAERDRIAALEAPVVAYCRRVDDLLAAGMHAGGWHRHKGRWCQGGRITRRVIMSQGIDDLDAATRAAGSRRKAAQDRLDEAMRGHRAGPADEVIEAILSRISPDPAKREHLRREVDRLRRELAGDDPSPLVGVLAERVAVCHLDASLSDLLAQSNCNLTAGDLSQRRQDRAQRRLLQAVKALAECRRIEASTIEGAVARFRTVG